MSVVLCIMVENKSALICKSKVFGLLFVTFLGKSSLFISVSVHLNVVIICEL